MAFAYTVDGSAVQGSWKTKRGTFTNADADTGGAITTGLNAVFGFSAISTSHVGSTVPKFSASGGVVTLVTDNGVDGNWICWGL